MQNLFLCAPNTLFYARQTFSPQNSVRAHAKCTFACSKYDLLRAELWQRSNPIDLTHYVIMHAWRRQKYRLSQSEHVKKVKRPLQKKKGKNNFEVGGENMMSFSPYPTILNWWRLHRLNHAMREVAHSLIAELVQDKHLWLKSICIH